MWERTRKCEQRVSTSIPSHQPTSFGEARCTLGQLEIANTIISDLQDAIVVRAWVENGSWGNSIDYRNCGVHVVKVGGAGHRRSSFSEFGVQYQYSTYFSAAAAVTIVAANGKPNTPSIVTSNQHPYLGGELRFSQPTHPAES